MRLWRVVLLMNMALGFGLFLGYLAWGRPYLELERELGLSRQPAPPAVERAFSTRGVVRAVFPDRNVVVLTHEDIPGYMPAMTMGFPVQEPRLYEGLDIGETVRVTLRGVPPNLVITAIARDGKP
ncbi:MAG TPA: copper-binding protein [Candidatus Methylomirabilis sp.]|nr:copper-binding protein [Candidatus Methylomirabilis sp.]